MGRGHNPMDDMKQAAGGATLFTPLRLPFGGKKESGWILERQGDGWIERDGAFLYSKELVRS